VNEPLQGAPGLAVLDTRPEDFSLDLTLGCGQVFHWEPAGAGYVGLMGEVPAYVEQVGAELRITPGVESVAARYFALDHCLDAIYATFPKDPAMSAALDFCRGLRLIRQPFWECLATFITSAMKQVPHIAQMSHFLRRRFGRAVSWQGQTLYAYPTPERIAMASEADLRECRLGFRAKNLLGAARMLADGEVDLAAIAQLEDEPARRELCRLPGVGVKVANCALLFAYERPRAFPIDVWIERILRELYFTRKRKVTLKRLKSFSEDYFGPHSGYAQQYLFHHARKTWKLRERQTVK
jgi:N-glycosylase/DNA lyase